MKISNLKTNAANAVSALKDFSKNSLEKSSNLISRIVNFIKDFFLKIASKLHLYTPKAEIKVEEQPKAKEAAPSRSKLKTAIKYGAPVLTAGAAALIGYRYYSNTPANETIPTIIPDENNSILDNSYAKTAAVGLTGLVGLIGTGAFVVYKISQLPIPIPF